MKSKEDTIIVLLSIDKAEALTLAIKCVIMWMASFIIFKIENDVFLSEMEMYYYLHMPWKDFLFT